MLQMNLLIEKKAANKQLDIFLRIVDNTCEIKLTLSIYLHFLSNV